MNENEQILGIWMVTAITGNVVTLQRGDQRRTGTCTVKPCGRTIIEFHERDDGPPILVHTMPKKTAQYLTQLRSTA